MIRVQLSSLVLLSMLTVRYANAQQQPAKGPPPVRAVFAIIDTTGARAGQVDAVQNSDGVLLQILATGLTPGQHGMHLHAAPACEPPAFASATGHLNPTGKKHGAKNPEGPHAGDLPNLLADATGEARSQVTIAGATLDAGPTSIGVPGTALVIHAKADDEMTDPSGSSGARVACAVLSVATP